MGFPVLASMRSPKLPDSLEEYPSLYPYALLLSKKWKPALIDLTCPGHDSLLRNQENLCHGKNFDSLLNFGDWGCRRYGRLGERVRNGFGIGKWTRVRIWIGIGNWVWQESSLLHTAQ